MEGGFQQVELFGNPWPTAKKLSPWDNKLDS